MGRGRAPCCEKVGLKKGSWTPAEDVRLMAYIQKHGHGNWRALPKLAGLLRCGKSCRLRWINYLRPDIKRGNFTEDEEEIIIKLHEMLGNKWSKIASRLPGRTDNEIKNVWNTHLKKRVSSKEQSPSPDKPEEPPCSPSSNSSASCSNQGDCPDHPEVCEEDDSSDDKIEILVEPNLDIWDILEEASPHPPNESNNKDMNMWIVHCDTDEPKQSLSSSSSFSDETYCNDLSEGRPIQVLPQPPYQFGYGGEDSVPDIPIELDMWNDVPDGDDDSNLFAPTVGSMGGQEAHDNPTILEEEEDLAKEVVGDSKKWIAYLEKELDLWGATNEDAIEPPQVNGKQAHGGVLLDVDMDPIASYLQKHPPSPSPFTLSFLDLSMT